MANICKQIDQFFDDKSFVVEVQLTNEESIFLDDGRPGFSPSSAWLRLKDYCDGLGVQIKAVFALCKNGKVPLIENAENQRLFAINRVAWFNGVSVDMFSLGTVAGDQIRVASYAKEPFGLVEITYRKVEGNEWLII